MEKILDDIYIITMDLPFKATPVLTLYYLDGEKPAIIDTGLGDPFSIEAIDTELNKIKRSLNNISVIINTHEHTEHFAGNKKIKEASNASVVASSIAAPFIENYHGYMLGIKKKVSELDHEMNSFLKRFIDFNLTIDEAKVDSTVVDGDIIDLGNFRLRVIHTPGHAAGHICLYDDERKILFSGDQVISKGTTFVGYGWRELSEKKVQDIFNDSDDSPDNLSLYLDSIKRLQSLDLKLILSSHGSPIEDPYNKLKENFEKKMNRVRNFLEIIEQKGEISLDKLIEEAYKKSTTGYLMQGAALGYLERLYKMGKISARLENGRLTFRIKN